MVSESTQKIVNWNVDSLDWKGLSAEQVTIPELLDLPVGK